MMTFDIVGDKHPADICFLPEVDNLDGGYLFVTREYESKSVAVYHYDLTGQDVVMTFFGEIGGFPFQQGPNLLFIDLVGDTYYLCIGSYHWQKCAVFTAKAHELFPKCAMASLWMPAFKPLAADNRFDFPIPAPDGPCQTKIVRDVGGAWYLLAFRGDPPTSIHSTDYVDAYPVTFEPFEIGAPNPPAHIVFPKGETGFASRHPLCRAFRPSVDLVVLPLGGGRRP